MPDDSTHAARERREAPAKEMHAYRKIEFSLAPADTDMIERQFRPFQGRELTGDGLSELAKIVEKALPLGALPQIRSMLHRKLDAPVVIHNISRPDQEKTLAERLKTDKNATTHSTTYLFARGIFELMGCRHEKTNVLVRRSTDPGHKIPSFQIHRDKFPVSGFMCLKNDIHAETHFMNIDNTLAALPTDVKSRLSIKPPTKDHQEPITLAELETIIDRIRYDESPCNQGITLAEMPAGGDAAQFEKDKALFHDVLNEQTIKIDVQPGTLVLWETAYHQAQSKETEALFPDGGRVAIFTGAGRPRQ